jgi:hypothetical protein
MPRRRNRVSLDANEDKLCGMKTNRAIMGFHFQLMSMYLNIILFIHRLNVYLSDFNIMDVSWIR